MTEQGHEVKDVPIPTGYDGNGNSRVIKIVWTSLGVVATVAIASMGVTNHLSSNFVSKEVYRIDQANLSTQIGTLNENIKALTTSINMLNNKLAYSEGRNSHNKQ